MEEFNNHTEQKIDIGVSDAVAEGTYANLAIITHSNSEFILDFVNDTSILEISFSFISTVLLFGFGLICFFL